MFEGQSTYEQELRNLTILRSGEFHHQRIMDHLGSVVIGGRFSIFYPWADFNLEEFFACEKWPPAIRDEDITPRSLLKESFGLAHALEYLHTQLHDEEGNSIQCCHMDLKPDNILVMFGDQRYVLGQWKIADFGISNIEPRSMSPSIRDFYNKTKATRSGTKPASVRTHRYPGPFQPPEAENPINWSRQPTKDLNDLKGDIWSLGCILLVVLVFAIGGKPYVDALADRRQTGLDYDDVNRSGRFYRKQPELQVMRSVTDWFNLLAKQQNNWFQRAWAFISGHMLVIDPAGRRGADIVRTEIKEWILKAENKNKWAESKLVTQLPNPAPAEIDMSNDRYSMLDPPVNTHVEHPLTPWLSHSTGQYPRLHAQTASMPDLTEEPTSNADQQTTDGNAGNIRTRASTFNHSRKTSDALSRSSTVSALSEDQVPMIDFSSFLQKETAVLADLAGHHIAFLNPERARIFSRTPEQAAAESTDESIFDIKSRSESSWEQMQMRGRHLVLRDANTLSVSHYPSWHASLDCIGTLTSIDIFLGPFW